MKKLLVIIAVITMLLTTAGTVLADGPKGPAPDSGDGIPNEDCLQYGLNGLLGGQGPAPNSGDGIPDGSGF